MAHITCSAEKVAEAAQKVINKINKCREERDEEKIAKAMKRKHLFSRKPYTRQDAIKYLDDSLLGWDWRCVDGWGDLSKATKLLLLTQHGDPIVIDEESAMTLWG